jgi:hypothetical protein
VIRARPLSRSSWASTQPLNPHSASHARVPARAPSRCEAWRWQSRSQGQERPGERKPKRCIAEREAEPDSGKHKGRRYAWIGLVGEAEIGDDAAGKKHRQPQEPAVRLGLERAGGCGKAKGQQCPSAPAGVRSSPPRGAPRPALTPHLPSCYITHQPPSLSIGTWPVFR